jgi:hypothetical protein
MQSLQYDKKLLSKFSCTIFECFGRSWRESEDPASSCLSLFNASSRETSLGMEGRIKESCLESGHELICY